MNVELLDEMTAELARFSAEIDEAHQVAAALVVRRDELLALIAKLTRETPYPAEANEYRSQRAALIAEVGTLRSELAELCLTDADRPALSYASQLIGNNPVAGCVDSVSTKHTELVNTARAAIARLLGSA